MKYFGSIAMVVIGTGLLGGAFYGGHLGLGLVPGMGGIALIFLGALTVYDMRKLERNARQK